MNQEAMFAVAVAAILIWIAIHQHRKALNNEEQYRILASSVIRFLAGLQKLILERLQTEITGEGMFAGFSNEESSYEVGNPKEPQFGCSLVVDDYAGRMILLFSLRWERNGVYFIVTEKRPGRGDGQPERFAMGELDQALARAKEHIGSYRPIPIHCAGGGN
jgi:hypothetical protein